MSSSTHSRSPPNSNNSLSPTNNTFTPRPEFLASSIVSPRHTFALLTLSSTSSLRLYSFPSLLISAVRALLTSRNLIHAVRETEHQSMIEFVLHGKLWTQPKSVPTERLLVDLFAVMYRAGWTYVSTIDYGREHDDRLAMTFRRGSEDLQGAPDKLAVVPFALSFPNATLLRVVSPPLHSTPAILAAVRGSWPRGVVNEKKAGDGVYEFKLKGYRWFEEDTFATDSLTHILGLLSSLDSHTFSLLTSLCLSNNRSRVKDLWIFTGPPPPDSPPASTLATTTHSPLLGHQKMSSLPTPLPLSPVSSSSTNGQAYHQRAATSPTHAPAVLPPPLPQSQPIQQPVVSSPPPSPGVLRKPAPRAQVPISVISQASDAGDQPPSNKPAPRAQVPESIVVEDVHEHSQTRPRTADLPPFGSPGRAEFNARAQIPSRVSETAEDMTGVGTVGQKTPDVFYTTSPFTPTAQANGYRSEVDSFYGAAGGVVEQAPQGHSGVTEEPFGQSGEETQTGQRIDNILHPNAFSSMALTSGSRSTSDMSQPRSRPSPPLSPPLDREDSVATRHIPIKWTGADEQAGQTLLVPPPPAINTRISSTPFFPGAWAPTPVHELPASPTLQIADPGRTRSLDGHVKDETPVHENQDHVASPTISAPEHGRKSEAGLVVTLEDGEWRTAKVPSPVTQETIPSPTSPTVPHAASTAAPAAQAATAAANGLGPNGHASPASPVGGQGWVIVDVAGQSTPPSSPQSNAPFPSSSVQPNGSNVVQPGPKTGLDEQAALSPSAKAIAMVDAVQEREKDRNESTFAALSRATSTPKTQESVSSLSSPGRSTTSTSKSGVRRFLSLSSPRKDKDRDGEKKSLRNRLRKWA